MKERIREEFKNDLFNKKLYFIQQQWAYGGMDSKIREKSGGLGFRGLMRVCISDLGSSISQGC